MAVARVFVDEAVLGRLPPLCAKTGTATESRLRVVERVGASDELGLLWLLLLLGPPGWLVLAVLLLLRRPAEQLAVEVPWSYEASCLLEDARRRCNFTDAFGVVVVAVAFLVGARGGIRPADLLLIVGVAAVAVVVHLAADQRLIGLSIGVSLDASRRWVTLRRVHPDFAAACNDQAASNHPD